MDAKTLEALKASIEKWERNAVAETPDEYKTSWRDCPLCHLFNHSDMVRDDRCRGCPVFDRSEEKFCDGTPFNKAAWTLERWMRGIEAQAAAHEAARAEVAFLKSLLPTDAERP